MKESRRLFVAVELPPGVRRELAALRAELPGMCWTPPDNLHLTLRFIGATDGDAVPGIKSGLATVRAPAFSLRMRGLGLFPRRGQTILWAGFELCPDLLVLKRAVDAALAEHAGLAPDQGRFSPHITLGRAKAADPAALRGFVRDYTEQIDARVPVSSFSLFCSVLEPGGARHTLEARYPFLP